MILDEAGEGGKGEEMLKEGRGVDDGREGKGREKEVKPEGKGEEQ